MRTDDAAFSSRASPGGRGTGLGAKLGLLRSRTAFLVLTMVVAPASVSADGNQEPTHTHEIAGATRESGSNPTIFRRATSDRLHEGIDGMLGVEVIFDVEAPPTDVLDIFWNVKRFRETFPDVKSVDVLEQQQNELVTLVRVDAVLAMVEYKTRRIFDPSAGRVSWVELGGDLERVRGSWTVTPFAGGQHSHVHYRSFVVVSAWVPESMYRELVFQKVDEMVKRVRLSATGAKRPGAEGLTKEK